MYEAICVTVVVTLTSIVLAAMAAWATILPTIGLLWCIGWL